MGFIDNSLKLQMNEEIGYWQQVLMRVICDIKFICERGLASRGQIKLLDHKKKMEIILVFKN